MTQKHATRDRRSEEEDVDQTRPNEGAVEAKDKRGEDIDALLDEIDAVIEPNAAEFVSAYVQKGGE